MLDLGGAGVKQEELDVRETPIQGDVENFFIQASANHDLATASGWTDLTSMTKTITLTEQKKVIILGNTMVRPGDDVVAFGAGLRIVIDGTEEANSERIFKINAYVGANDVYSDGLNTEINLSTQHVKTLNTGDHIIKLQGKGLADGTTTAARFKKRNLSILTI